MSLDQILSALGGPEEVGATVRLDDVVLGGWHSPEGLLEDNRRRGDADDTISVDLNVL